MSSQFYVNASISTAPVAGDSEKDSTAIELYKLEYERASQRYDDVYKAAWTIFSYMAIVAGAILTFGGDRFLPEVSAFLACLPLLFWWLASFEPLNKYGDQVIDRLAQIEKNLNNDNKLEIKDPATGHDEKPIAVGTQTQNQAGDEVKTGLRHFTEFKTRESNRPIKPINCFRWICALAVVGLIFYAAGKISGFWEIHLLILIGGLILVPVVWLIVEVLFVKMDKSPPVDKKSIPKILRKTLQQLRRVRFVVRTFGFLLLITAGCLGFKAISEGTNKWITKKSPEVRVIPIDLKQNVGVKLEGANIEQLKELIQRAEKEREAQTPAPSSTGASQ